MSRRTWARLDDLNLRESAGSVYETDRDVRFGACAGSTATLLKLLVPPLETR